MGGEGGRERGSVNVVRSSRLPPLDRSYDRPAGISHSIFVFDRQIFLQPSGGAAGESISSVEELLLSEQVIRKNQIDRRKPRT